MRTSQLPTFVQRPLKSDLWVHAMEHPFAAGIRVEAHMKVGNDKALLVAVPVLVFPVIVFLICVAKNHGGSGNGYGRARPRCDSLVPGSGRCWDLSA